jgi:dihydrofolate synthase/folylpolyglutamate synthase
MTYQQTLDYMYAQLPMFHRVGGQAYKADLKNTIEICELLGNPQHSFKSVHITGTNGKGSVSHMLASVLETAGYRTGLYTSPHLKDFRERIRVNGKMIPKSSVRRFIAKYKSGFEPVQPSFFELTVGMAFDYFRSQQVDIAVIEVGLGGRLDSTNIINPLLSVITNVSFDHMQFLGDTLEKIAEEKAGIIKPSVPVVIGETQDALIPVFQSRAEACNTTLFFSDQHYAVERFDGYKRQPDKRVVDISLDGHEYLSSLISPLAGYYQRKNIVTVLGACRKLNEQGINLPVDAIRKGIRNVIKNTGLQGRWQIIGKNPLTICDTGHNEAGLREVLMQIASTPHKKLHVVFGVVNDKHLPPVFDILPLEATYYFCKPDIPRGLDAKDLQQQAFIAGFHGMAYPSVGAALESARLAAGDGDLVFVGGSTFVVAEVV